MNNAPSRDVPYQMAPVINQSMVGIHLNYNISTPNDQNSLTPLFKAIYLSYVHVLQVYPYGTWLINENCPWCFAVDY